MRPQILASTLCAFFLFAGVSLQAKESFKKEFDKSYSINSDATLELETSFADVVVQNWDQNKIEIHVEVIVEARSEEAAEKIFKEIEVTMVGTSSRVELKTDIDIDGNHGGAEWHININIKAPKSVGIDAHHDFGSLHLADFSGQSDVHLGYGELKAGSLSHKDNDITVSFGEGNIEHVGGGDIKCEFGEMELEKLSGSADISNSYGEFEIEMVTADCGDMDIDNEFGEIEITLSSGGTYDLEFNSSFGDVDLPGSAEMIKESEDFTSKSGRATIGKGSSSCSIEIETSFGEVDIDID